MIVQHSLSMIVIALHSYFFDGSWLCNDGFSSRCSNNSICQFKEFYEFKFEDYSTFKPENFFPGAYTYHVHMKGNEVSNDSYFNYFERYYKSYLDNLIIFS